MTDRSSFVQVTTVHAEESEHSAAPSDLRSCQCRINKSGCLVCRRWDRTIRGSDARRADSLRRQSMGDLIRVGG